MRARRGSSVVGRFGSVIVTGALAMVGCSGPNADDAAASKDPAASAVASSAAGAADPVSATHIATGKRLMEEGRYDEAVEHFTQALAVGGDSSLPASTDSLAADVYFQRGLAFLKLGFPDTAVEDFSEVITLAPKYAPGYVRRGEAQHQLGDSYNALCDSTEAIRLDPQNSLAYRIRGQVYLGRAIYERATADLEQAIHLEPALADEVRPQLATAYARWSEELAQTGQGEAAAQRLAKAKELAPEMGQPAEVTLAAATEPVEQSVAKPVIDEASIKVEAGLEHFQAERYESAMMAFSEAIALRPDFAQAYLRRGETLLAMGFPDTAREDFRELRRRGEETAELHRLDAQALLDLGRPHRAALAATESLHLDPVIARSYAIRGKAYLQMEQWDRSIVDLQEAIRRDAELAEELQPLVERRRNNLTRRTPNRRRHHPSTTRSCRLSCRPRRKARPKLTQRLGGQPRPSLVAAIGT